ncbi:hypothetical protein FE840_005735 [Peteryoungia desertarenae]|uniref:Uncharacterized protein n=1 Tax=Peteryoungia desertarenae TaxID=1813451 RepID=A0ABX6QKI4_9HYPH|nr:hypothetical protein [Peteryoungia desertarenae]QLF69081.1 hypothetical protein FE840_005735 [Peteryoungia desertarenae]
MVRLIFRLGSLLSLCLGVIAATIDSIQSVSISSVALTPISATISDFSPDSLVALQALIEQYLGQATWSAFSTVILPQPAFAVFFGLALVFWMMGYKKPSPAGRFAA